METLEYLEPSGFEIYQDDDLYRFTSDALRLSEFACVKKGDVVADFCSGCGVVGFNLFGLHPEKIKSVTFFEMQKPLYDLSVKSIDKNNLGEKFFAVNTRVQDLPKSYYGKFSLAVCNPPYMQIGAGEHDKSQSLALCRREISLPLTELAAALSNALKFGGRACVVHRADRLTDVLVSFRNAGIEPKRIRFVSAAGKPPYLFLLEAVKGGKSGIKIMENLLNQV